jgi:hypothetical protein
LQLLVPQALTAETELSTDMMGSAVLQSATVSMELNVVAVMPSSDESHRPSATKPASHVAVALAHTAPAATAVDVGVWDVTQLLQVR